jgi:hypothetical protein
MDRISHSTAVDIGGGRMGFRSKDTVGGVPGTVLTATHMNATQEEMLAAIEEAGEVPDPNDLKQIVKVIRGGRLNWRSAGGTANALTVALAPQLLAYVAGLPLRIMTGGNANTGAMTLNVDGLGAKAIIRRSGAAMTAGDVPASSLLEVVYDGVAFRMVGLVTSDLIAQLNAAGQPPQLNFFEMTTANTQSVPTSTVTVVNDFSLQGSKPSDAAFSAGGLVTVGLKTAGVWVFSQAYYPSQVGGAPSTVQAYLFKNGSIVTNQTVAGTFCTNSGSVRVAAGDVLSMAVWQNSGGGRTNQHAGALPLTTVFNLYQISS